MCAYAEKDNIAMAMIFKVNDDIIDVDLLKSNLQNELNISIKDKLVDKDGTIIFHVDNTTYVIARMPDGIPVKDFQSASDRSLLYKNKENLAQHQKSHIICSVVNDKNTLIKNRIILTKLIRSVLKSTESLGIYWGDACQIVQSEIFMAFTDQISEKSLPIPVWINICVYKNENNRINVYTIGMKVFSYPEYEIINLKMNREDAYYFLLDFLNSLLTTGVKLKDGDTIGRDENEKFKVHYIESFINGDSKVMKIEM
ncbi:MAG: DUF4261 domain-containing protein [Spirochaetales bacterium]|nr:DUF4261 domain-containing protein [Spirochaetales bacterium]